MTVLLDTSLLVRCAELGVDPLELLESSLSEPFEPAVTRGVVRELEALASSGSHRRRAAARAALEYVRRRGLSVLEDSGRGPADRGLLELASTLGAVVATADRGLRDEALRRGLRALILWESRRALV